MRYELWSTDTGNVIDTVDGELAAFRLVLEIENANREWASLLLLGKEDSDGSRRPVAEGAALVALARKRLSAAAKAG